METFQKLSNILEKKPDREKGDKYGFQKNGAGAFRERQKRHKEVADGDHRQGQEGKAVAAKLDDAALRDAAKRGDTAALKSILAEVLSSPEGKALADKVQKAVGKK